MAGYFLCVSLRKYIIRGLYPIVPIAMRNKAILKSRVDYGYTQAESPQRLNCIAHQLAASSKAWKVVC